MSDGGQPKEGEYQQIEAIMRAALPHVASQQGKKFSRQIFVANGAGGDLRVSKDKVTINPAFATKGDPLTVCLKILQSCEDYDRRVVSEREAVRDEARDALRRNLRWALRVLDVDEVLEIVGEYLDKSEPK